MSTFPDIAQLIPHAEPMIVVDQMVEWREGYARCEATLSQGRRFVTKGGTDALATIEHMAQTVAACLGYEAFQHGEGVRVGMIIACRRFELHTQRIDAGERLEITAERVRGNETLSHFEGTVHCEGVCVASADLTVFHAEKPPEAVG